MTIRSPNVGSGGIIGNHLAHFVSFFLRGEVRDVLVSYETCDSFMLKKIHMQTYSKICQVLPELMRYIHRSQVKKPLIQLPQLICKKPGSTWPRAPSQLLGSMDWDPESSTTLVTLHALGISGPFGVGCYSYYCWVVLINQQTKYFKGSIVFLPFCDSCIIAH